VRSIVWRIVPSALPTWPRPCGRCSETALEATGRFRVNSNGPVHDVWLLYACRSCGWGAKRSILRRVREGPERDLTPYRANDATAAALWAFHLGRGECVPYAVERPALPRRAAVLVAIEQAFPCLARWDALLARELTMPRSRVRAAWGSGVVPVSSSFRPRDRIRAGQRLVLRPGAACAAHRPARHDPTEVVR
jgi:hypothetical protein